MIFLLSLIAGGTTLVIDPAHPNGAIGKPVKAVAAASDIEVQIAQAPAGVTLPVAVKSAVWTDPSGKVIGCRAVPGAAPAFAPLACKQVEALPPFPVQYDEYNRPIAAVRSITVSFNTAH